jgi:hypothetical protein
MIDLEELRPATKVRVMDLLHDTGVDVSDWAIDFKGKHPSANPKYCYNWSFEKPGEFVVTCIWHLDLEKNEDDIFFSGNLRKPLRGKGKAQWKARATAFDEHLQLAYRDALPIKAIILAGRRRDDDDPEPESSIVSARYMDDQGWAITYYDFDSGDFTITRGALPVPDVEQDDPGYSSFEGEQRRLYILHRRRESSLRKKKIMAAMYENRGLLKCEVPNCGFDFKARYGAIGDGFAHVHHLKPLADAPPKGMKINLRDLAVVCANCHAMIHVGGQNRPLAGLIPKL